NTRSAATAVDGFQRLSTSCAGASVTTSCAAPAGWRTVTPAMVKAAAAALVSDCNARATAGSAAVIHSVTSVVVSGASLGTAAGSLGTSNGLSRVSASVTKAANSFT